MTVGELVLYLSDKTIADSIITFEQRVNNSMYFLCCLSYRYSTIAEVRGMVPDNLDSMIVEEIIPFISSIKDGVGKSIYKSGLTVVVSEARK